MLTFPKIYLKISFLKEGGNPKKLASWLEAVQLVYPNNPYMSLFAALSYILTENKEMAQNQLTKTKKKLDGSQYWNSRFAQFGLTDIVNNFPMSFDETQKVLDPLRKRYSEWTGDV